MVAGAADLSMFGGGHGLSGPCLEPALSRKLLDSIRNQLVVGNLEVKWGCFGQLRIGVGRQGAVVQLFQLFFFSRIQLLLLERFSRGSLGLCSLERYRMDTAGVVDDRLQLPPT